METAPSPAPPSRSRYLPIAFAAAVNLIVLGGAVYLWRRPEPRPLVVLTPVPRSTATTQPLVIDVRGAVVHPGLYTLARGSRVQDALTAAGGTEEQANLDKVNPAKILSDGEQVLVPTRVPTPTATKTLNPSSTPTAVVTGASTTGASSPAGTTTGAAAPGTSGATPSPARININTASAEEMVKLPGIGPALAQRIVDYRKQNGPFRSVEEIQKVKGIGATLFAEIKDLITV